MKIKVTLALLLCLLLVGCADDIGRGKMDFKFVSVGQAPADAAVFSQVLQGNSLKPLAPVNLRGTRDSVNNLLIEWTRRSRIGAGMIPGTGVPLGESTEAYDVVISSATPDRTFRVVPGVSIPAVLIGVTQPSFVSGNNVLEPVSATVLAYSYQQVHGPSDWIEATLVNTLDNNGGAFLTITADTQGAIAGSPSAAYQFVFSQVSGVGFIQVFDNASLVVYSGFVGRITSFRVRAVVRQGGLEFYWDYVPGATPFYTAPMDPPLPMILSISNAVGSRVNDVQFGSSLPSVMYPAALQTADGLTPGNPISVTVYQVSSVIGRGYGVTKTL